MTTRALLGILSLVIFFFGVGLFISAQDDTVAAVLPLTLEGQSDVATFSNLNAEEFLTLLQYLQQVPLQNQQQGNNNNIPQGSFPNVKLSVTGNFNIGGQLFMTVQADPTFAGLPFALAFSLDGDYPGLQLPDNSVFPLNLPYPAILAGQLDRSGRAQFTIPIPRDRYLEGLQLSIAATVVHPFLFRFFNSNPVTFTIGKGLTGVSCCTLGVKGAPDSQCIDGGVSVNYCRLTLEEGAVQECIPQDVGRDPPPANFSNLPPGNTTAHGGFIANLTRDIGLSNITRRVYNATTYDCDDFADDLERWLQGLGYRSTYTQYVKYVGVNSSVIDYIHAVTDVHLPDGTTIWIEPQNGRVINLDFDGDGQVEANVNDPYRNGHHPTDDNAKIYVYDDAATAAANGAPRD